jgi:hypothetical protein
MNDFPEKLSKDLLSLRNDCNNYYQDSRFVIEYCLDGNIKRYNDSDEILGHFGDSFVSDRIDTIYLNDVKDNLNDVKDNLLNVTKSLNKLRLEKAPKHSKVDIDKLLPKDFKFKSIDEFYNTDWIEELTNNINKYIDEL